jgi:hypothetical protein
MVLGQGLNGPSLILHVLLSAAADIVLTVLLLHRIL